MYLQFIRITFKWNNNKQHLFLFYNDKMSKANQIILHS